MKVGSSLDYEYWENRNRYEKKFNMKFIQTFKTYDFELIFIFFVLNIFGIK